MGPAVLKAEVLVIYFYIPLRVGKRFCIEKMEHTYSVLIRFIEAAA